MNYFYLALLICAALTSLKEIKDTKKRNCLIGIYSIMLVIASAYVAGEYLGQVVFQVAHN